MDATCSKCGKRFGWSGTVEDHPGCPRCGYRPPAERLAQQERIIAEHQRRIAIAEREVDPRVADPTLVVDLLNEIARRDRTALAALINYRVPCNDLLAEHPAVQVGPPEDQTVGLLGIINGLCGVRDDGWGHVAAVFNGGDLVGFKVLERGRV